MYTINESRIAELKEKHGSVYLIKVEDKQAVFKKPSRQDLSYPSYNFLHKPLHEATAADPYH